MPGYTPASPLALGLLPLLASCSLGRFESVPCTTNQTCRAAYGLGSVCAEDGLCATAELPDRCVLSEPDPLTLPVDPAQTLLIGTLFDHSLDTHLARVRSAQLALTRANGANPALEGRDFGVLHCTHEEDAAYDDLTQDEATVALAEFLAFDLGVPAILGPAASGRTEAAYNAIQGSGALLISPSATSPALTALDGATATDAEPGLLWRTAPPDSLQGVVIAEDMLERGVRQVAVVYQRGAYGEGLAEVFVDELDAGGGSVTRWPYDDAEGPSAAIVGASDDAVEEVLFISSDVDDIVTFLNAAATLSDYSALNLFLTDAARNSDVLAGVSGDALDVFERVRGTGPSVPDGDVYQTFVADYFDAWREDVTGYSYTAHSYDAAWLLAYGHAWALHQEGEVTGEAIARGLRRVSNPSGAEVEVGYVDWSLARDELRDGRAFDVVGASGPLDYDSATEETRADVDVWVVLDGEITVEYVREF